jgi:hypothetical protein
MIQIQRQNLDISLNIKIYLSNVPATLFLVIHAKVMKSIYQRTIYLQMLIAVLLTIAKMWNKSWGQNRQKDKENVVWIQNGILFSHKEERNSVTCHKVEET